MQKNKTHTDTHTQTHTHRHTHTQTHTQTHTHTHTERERERETTLSYADAFLPPVTDRTSIPPTWYSRQESGLGPGPGPGLGPFPHSQKLSSPLLTCGNKIFIISVALANGLLLTTGKGTTTKREL